MRGSPLAAATLMLAIATGAASAPKPPPPDLADMAQGVYMGDVISDSRGAGRPGVTITVTKTARNTVRVSSDYDRLPTFTTRLAKYMNTIQKTGPGGEVFLLELSKSPATLGVTDDQASWSGARSDGG